MDVLTELWVTKAEADYITAARELDASESPNYEAVCFHAHQCAERYLKALLQAADIPFPNTIHLVVLLYLYLDLEPDLKSFRDHLRMLTSNANHSNDCEWVPNVTIAQQSFTMCSEFRKSIRKSLGI